MSDYKEDPIASAEPELENPDRKVVKRTSLHPFTCTHAKRANALLERQPNGTGRRSTMQ